jgi:hypothetical protein
LLNLQFVEGEAEQKSIDRLFGKGNGKHGAGDIIAHDFEIGPSPLLPSETPPPEDPAPRVERVAVPMLSLGSVCTICEKAGPAKVRQVSRSRWDFMTRKRRGNFLCLDTVDLIPILSFGVN